MLLAGQIGKPHGVTGEVYVIRISDDPRRFEPGSILRHADGYDLTVESSRSHRDRLLVRFEGISSRPEAEDLRGALYVSASDQRELESDEYWERDVIGCMVELADGTAVGEIVRLVPGAAQDLFEVETSNGMRLIPFVKEIVVRLDMEARRVIVDPPAGLLD
jgi:16S rRNA processing protein RimM